MKIKDSRKKIKLEEIERFEINISNEYHILRHFSHVESNYTESIIGKQYKYYHYWKNHFKSSKIELTDIHLAYNTIGSKFFTNVPWLENPKKVLKLVKSKFLELIKKNVLYWQESGLDQIVSFSFDYWIYVGEKDVILMKELKDTDRKKVIKVQRSNHPGEEDLEVNTLKGFKKNKTSYINVEITKTKYLPFLFVSAYPRWTSLNISESDEIVFLV